MSSYMTVTYLVKFRKSASHRTGVHSCHVSVRTEHDHFAVVPFISFHPFEQLDGVVEATRGRVLQKIEDFIFG